MENFKTEPVQDFECTKSKCLFVCFEHKSSIFNFLPLLRNSNSLLVLHISLPSSVSLEVLHLALLSKT